ncbi:DUF2235 domain-containing protein [Sulfitobacter geojensis]|uniref:DUF2235 domain-containing protein n=1 Tax=Sulfitobacter geojensis TaxID=1342299 RepID=UPI003B8E7512
MRAGSRQSNPKGDQTLYAQTAPRAAATHVIVLDGTLSSLEPLHQTNAARTYMLLKEQGAAYSLYYEAGLQWDKWRSVLDVASGKGINRLIRRAYGWLASRYRPGDRIFLFGYSRGAYAVRSLAGVIDMVGLLRAEHATTRNIRMAYRHYECSPEQTTRQAFRAAHCHDAAEIEMIGVWDTVKSLGINAPVLWRLSEHLHAFHNHDLSGVVRNGFHALAHDENRVAYKPVLWQSHAGFSGRVEQVWFPGAHGDVGGQLGGFEAARPLANIPLVWMLEQAESCDLPLPTGWRGRFTQDAMAPARGTWRGHGKILMSRKKRIIGHDPSERLHESIALRQGSLVDPETPARAADARNS